MFFFLKYLFLRPPSLDIGFFSDLKQRNKRQWPNVGRIIELFIYKKKLDCRTV